MTQNNQERLEKIITDFKNKMIDKSNYDIIRMNIPNLASEILSAIELDEGEIENKIVEWIFKMGIFITNGQKEDLIKALASAKGKVIKIK